MIENSGLAIFEISCQALCACRPARSFEGVSTQAGGLLVPLLPVVIATGTNVGVAVLPSIVTRSAKTRKSYIAIADKLYLAAEAALGFNGKNVSVEAGAQGMITWFLSQDGVWEPATIRVYRAALVYFLEAVCKSRPNDVMACAILDRLKKAKGPASREGGAPRTSARKRKAMTPEEASAIVACLDAAPHRYAPLAAGLLRYGIEFGLRPCEWQSAHIECGVLVVSNAKSTNGRSNGATRSLILSSYTEEEIASLRAFLDALAAAIRSEPWAKIYRALRAQLAVACVKAATTVPSLRGKPVAFYTGRQVAGARAKKTMTRSEVAALMGHATDRTAQTHYARARSARLWKPLATMADPAQVATVRRVYREREAPDDVVSSCPKVP